MDSKGHKFILSTIYLVLVQTIREKIEILNILIFGSPAHLQESLASFLGNTRKSQRMVYFEFPNKKFSHPTISKNFPEKLKLFLLPQSLLKSVLAPKREFNAANFLIWLFDWDDPASLETGFKYLELIVQTRKSFLPIFLIGIRSSAENRSNQCPQFLKYYRFHKELEGLTQMPVKYLEIESNITEPQFISHLSIFIKEQMSTFGKHYQITKYSSIALEKITKEMQSIIGTVKNATPEFGDLILDLCVSEIELNRPITRQFLINNFGCEPSISKSILDKWDQRPNIQGLAEGDLETLKTDSEKIFNIFEESGNALNFTELVKMGYNPTNVQKVLRHLFNSGKIASISHHIESEEFIEFQNVKEFLVLHDGRTLYVKTVSKDTDQTLMFANMIQAIEMIRNDYILKAENITIPSLNKIEFLEFGDLKAFIGNGNTGLKLVIRLNDRPRHEQNLRIRIKKFIATYEDSVNLQPTAKVQDQREIRKQSERIFYQYFNPFPMDVDVFQVLKATQQHLQPLTLLTDIEQTIMKILKQNGPLMLEDLISAFSEKMGNIISRSDALQYILDLMNEKFIA